MKGLWILSLAVSAFAGDGTLTVVGYMVSNWQAAANAFTKQKSDIDHYLAGRGQACGSGEVAQVNDALLKISDTFYSTNLQFIQGAYAAGDTVNKPLIIAGFAAYRDSLQSRVVSKVCNEAVKQDSLTLWEINNMGYQASLYLAQMSPPVLVRKLAPTRPHIADNHFRFSYDLLGRQFNQPLQSPALPSVH